MSDYGSTPPPPPGGGDGGYSAPPPPAGGGFGGAPPDNKLVWSILVTLFCCLPLGIVAIVKSAEVNSKWAAGDHAGAQQSAADAAKWIKYSVILGVVGIVLYLIFVVGLGVIGATSS
jgi:interferon-induced transmembrane protein